MLRREIEGRPQAGAPLAQVAISFNKRTYRFQCAEHEAARLEQLANYLKSKLDELMAEHGPIGDERLVLMAALTLADELFDARADIDDLLENSAGQRPTAADDKPSKVASISVTSAAPDETLKSPR